MSTYLPPHIEQAMTEHLQNTMPGNLKQYQGADTYVPQHAADAIREHMDATLPGHMKQYAGAYMQQRVIRPGMVTPSGNSQPDDPAQILQTGAAAPPPFMPSSPVGQNPTVITPSNGPAAAPEEPAGPPDRDASYSFITDPAAAPPHKSVGDMIPTGNSAVIRAALIGGGLIILIIIFMLFRNVLSSGNKATAAVLINVAQDQQEMVHLASNAYIQTTLSDGGRNFAANVQLSMGSSQSQLVSYMATNHIKVGGKKLNLKVTTSLDDQLTAAAGAGTYDQDFKKIMKTKLDAYAGDLQAAYKQETGKKGRTLLKDSFDQIKLFEYQLNQQAS